MISKFSKLIYTRVDLPMLKSKFCSFPAISLLVRMGVGVGVGGEKLKIKLNSAQLELDLGLSLATVRCKGICAVFLA